MSKVRLQFNLKIFVEVCKRYNISKEEVQENITMKKIKII